MPSKRTIAGGVIPPPWDRSPPATISPPPKRTDASPKRRDGFWKTMGRGGCRGSSCTLVSRAGWVEPRGRVSLGGAPLHVQDHMGRPHPGNTSRPAPPYYPGKSRLMPGPSLGAQSTWRADLWVVGGAAPTGLCASWRQSRLERGAQGVDLVGAVEFFDNLHYYEVT